MKTTSKVILGLEGCSTRGSERVFLTDSEKRALIREYLSGGQTKQAIWQKYTGQRQEHGGIFKLMRQFGLSPESMGRNPNFNPMAQKIIPKDAASELHELRKKIAELEKQLQDAELKATAFSTLVDIAERELKIPIRKKYNTKPSKK